MPRTTQPGLSPYITWQGNSLHTIFSQQVHKFHTHQYHCVIRWRVGVCGRQVSQHVSMKNSTQRCAPTVQMGSGDIVDWIPASFQCPCANARMQSNQCYVASPCTRKSYFHIFSYLSGSVFPYFAQFPVFCSKIPGETTASKWRYFCTFDSLHDLFPSCGGTLVRSRHSRRHVTSTFWRWIRFCAAYGKTDVSKVWCWNFGESLELLQIFIT